MASNYGIRGSNSDKIEVFTKNIEEDLQKAQESFLKAAGKFAKESTMRSIERSEISDPLHIHIKDDVKLSIVQDKKIGGKVAKIRGGKTGTLWHIVNDGTYRSKATHFLDKAIGELDAAIDSILDETLASLGG